MLTQAQWTNQVLSPAFCFAQCWFFSPQALNPFFRPILRLASLLCAQELSHPSCVLWLLAIFCQWEAPARDQGRGREDPSRASSTSSARWSPVVLAVAGSPSTHPWPLLHLGGPCSSGLCPKEGKTFSLLRVPGCLTSAQFSLDSSRGCLLFPAGSQIGRSRTWNEKHQVPSGKGSPSHDPHPLHPAPTWFLARVVCAQTLSLALKEQWVLNYDVLRTHF